MLTVVGLYSNIPENGYIDPDQATWLAGELAQAPTDRPLIVTSHHPALSLDRYHGGSAPMLGAIDTSATGGTVAYRSRRPSDDFGGEAVLSGGTDNYKRGLVRVDTGE